MEGCRIAKYPYALTSVEEDIRDTIEYAIKFYHEDEKLLATLKADMIPSQISRYGLTAGDHNSEQRPTEDIAVKMAANVYIFNLELKVSAVGAVYNALPDLDKKLVHLYFWSRNKLTPDGIAMELNIGRATVYAHLNRFRRDVGRRLGYNI